MAVVNHQARRPLTPFAKTIVALEAFLGAGAVLGGGALVLAPDGHLLGMSPALLAGSPFRDYLVPGAVLFDVIGVGALIAAVLTVLRLPAAPVAAVAVGVALIAWIAVEMVILAGWGSVAWTFYMLLGAAIAGAGVAWSRSAKTG